MFIATLVLIGVTAPTLSKECRVHNVTTFKESEIEGFVTYQPGGRKKMRAWRVVDSFTAKTVVFVCNAGYFDPKSRPRVAVDFVLSKGVVLVPYRHDLSRRIIGFGDNGEIRIFVGPNGQPYRDFLAWQAVVGCQNAVAGDDSAIEPDRRTWRRIVGKRSGEIVVVTLANANQRDCMVYIESAETRLDEFIFMDGGSSTLPGTTVTTHLVFFAAS